MKPVILLTRAEEHLDKTAADVTALGCDVIADSMLHIKVLKEACVLAPDTAALIVTSRNALPALQANAQSMTFPLFVVGHETAILFKNAGFNDIRGIAETSAQLPELIKKTLRPQDGRLVHVTSEHAHTEFYDALLDAGYGLEQCHVYEAQAAQALSPQTITALQAGRIHGILFYSARTASIFQDLLQQAGLSNTIKSITAYCLSHAVADALEKELWNNILVAKSPTHQALMDCLAKRG